MYSGDTHIGNMTNTPHFQMRHTHQKWLSTYTVYINFLPMESESLTGFELFLTGIRWL